MAWRNCKNQASCRAALSALNSCERANNLPKTERYTSPEDESSIEAAPSSQIPMFFMILILVLIIYFIYKFKK